MILDAVFDYAIFNGEIIKLNDIVIENTNKEIYEVIRIIDGKPLYLKEHLDRLKKSAMLMGYEINKEESKILNEIKTLVKVNNIKNNNIKILINNLENEKQNYLIYFIKSYYPDKKVYEEGIDTIIINRSRENPNVKYTNNDFREYINIKIKEKNAFEAILVNKEGHITEGSKSNIFFIKNDKVYTSPNSEVLLGVTRDKIFKVCKELNIEIIKKYISLNEIFSFDGAFITGTSIGVLQIRSIDNLTYSINNHIYDSISKGYLEDVKKDIENIKW